MKRKTKISNLAGGILDRSEMIKALTQATTGLLPEDTQLSSAALARIIGPVVQALESMALRMGDQLATQLAQKLADEKLIGAVTRIADALILRASDQFAGQIAKRLADSQVTNALAGKFADQLAARLADKKLIGAVTQIADALVSRATDQLAEKVAARLADKKFIGAVAGQFAALQGQPQPAKGKRKA